MADSFWTPSRVLALVLVLGAGAWIASGVIAPHAEEAAPGPKGAETTAKQRVAVETVTTQKHSRSIVLSGVTQANARAFASARGAGTVKEIKVAKGGKVKAGDLVAIVSDEGRQAAVDQAKALLEQRTTEFEAQRGLIQRGILPRNQSNALESGVAAAKAALAAAQAELDRASVFAPISGVVNAVPVEVGQVVAAGTQIAEIINPDPMLAVGYVVEKDRGVIVAGQKADIRFIDGRTAKGTVSFVALAGEKGTRTYRVDAKIDNADAAIADGITCEIAMTLEPTESAPIPRSALVFSDEGKLGVRTVDEKDTVRFIPVSLVDNQGSTLWVKGVTGSIRLITVGQDFVKDGDVVEPAAPSAASKS